MTVDPFDQRFSILVDHDKLRQILISLLSNAVKLRPAKVAAIYVSAEIDERTGLAVISDPGQWQRDERGRGRPSLLPFGKGEGGLETEFRWRFGFGSADHQCAWWRFTRE